MNTEGQGPQTRPPEPSPQGPLKVVETPWFLDQKQRVSDRLAKHYAKELASPDFWVRAHAKRQMTRDLKMTLEALKSPRAQW